MIAVDLIFNLTILIALSVVSGFIDNRWKRNTRTGVLLQGVLFGGTAVIGMLKPWVLAPGLVFDGRSVMVSLGALFFGPWTAAVSCLMTIPVRIFQGGPGMYMGILVILSSALAGIVFHSRQRSKAAEMSSLTLLGFGVVVHVAMLAMTLALPAEMRLSVLKKIGWPVMLTYPLATVLIGKILTDQASRARFVQALQESELRYRELVEHANSVILRITPEGNITFINEFAQRFFGFSSEEILGRNVVGSIVPATDTQGRDLASVIRDLGEHPERYEVHENENIRKDGSRCWLAWTNKAILDEEGRYMAVLCVGTDLTEHKRGEEALRRSEALYHSLVENLPQQIIRKDREGRFTFANAAFCRLLGRSLPEILGKTDFDFYPAHLAEKYQKDDRRVLEMQQSLISDEENVLPSGDKRQVHVVKIPILDRAGMTVGVQCVFEDITERRVLEEQLRQAQRLESIGQLAGGVAHDFNNILASMMMHLSLLQMKQNPDPDVRETLLELMVEAKRAAGLTRQLLMFSRRSVMEVKALDLNEMVANLLKMLGRLIGENIRLRFDQCDRLPLVEADPGMIEQVLMNLAVNARDAMPKGGRLTISTETLFIAQERVAGNAGVQPGQFVCVTVADDGCGMDESTRKRIFEPFFTTKEVGKGTGLGLATVHGIVVQHKGWVEVDSEVGRGTTFRVFLPASSKNASDQSSTLAPSIQGGHETILLVEDEANVRRALVQALGVLGYRVLEAANGNKAMGLWQTHAKEIDLLFSDMVMPEGITGLDLVERFKEERPDLKVIISSGYATEMLVQGRAAEGGVVYLAKPFEMEAVSKIVRQCLDSK